MAPSETTSLYPPPSLHFDEHHRVAEAPAINSNRVSSHGRSGDSKVFPTETAVNPAGLSLFPTETAVNPTGLSLFPTETAVNLTGLSMFPTETAVNPTGLSLFPTETAVNLTGLSMFPTETASKDVNRYFNNVVFLIFKMVKLCHRQYYF
jgi:hypothetical protein